MARRKPCEHTKIPTHVISPPGEWPFSTAFRTDSFYLKIPSAWVLLSIHWLMTHPFNLWKRSGFICCASLVMSVGLNGYPAFFLATSIYGQISGFHQLTCFASSFPCMDFQPDGLFVTFTSSLNHQWGRESSASLSSSPDSLNASRCF